MSLKPAHLQALFARRREIAQNRIERTEAVNKYFDHWGKVTARFENWTAPDYYKQSEERLAHTKQQKEKQIKLTERQEKLAQLLKMEKQIYEEEMEEKQKNKSSRGNLDTQTLVKINENLQEQQQMRQKLDLEAKLYGKWRHGVEDENILFESRNDNEVLAKLNWLDKQVHQQMQREKEQEIATERQWQLQYELNRTEELQNERHEIREKEIREIRCMQEYHLGQIKERQKETDDLKEREKKFRENMNVLNKDMKLLDENYSALNPAMDFIDTFNMNRIKIFTRKRSEEFRNQINLCLDILERSLAFFEKSEVLQNFKKRLEQQLEKESEKLLQLEGMYESEAKYSLRRSEQNWQVELTERYNELKQILIEEHRAINAALTEVMKRHEELLEIRATHMNIIENSGEKLKLLLIQEEQNSPQNQEESTVATKIGVKHVGFGKPTNNIIHSQTEESAGSSLHAPHESDENTMSSKYRDVNKMSNSFTDLSMDVYQTYQGHPSKLEKEDFKTNAQRAMQVVTSETEAERPRFGRKHMAWD